MDDSTRFRPGSYAGPLQAAANQIAGANVRATLLEFARTYDDMAARDKKSPGPERDGNGRKR